MSEFAPAIQINTTSPKLRDLEDLKPKHGFFDWDTWRASFERNSEVGSALATAPSRLSELKTKLGRPLDLNFTPDIKGYEAYWREFRYDNTPEEVASTKADIDRELGNIEILNNLDGPGMVGSAIAGTITSPLTLARIGLQAATFFAAAPLGPVGQIAATAAAGAVEGAGVTHVREKFLRDSQRLRSEEESDANVIAGAITGATLGALGAGLAHVDFKKAAAAVKNWMNPPPNQAGYLGLPAPTPPSGGGSAGPGYVPPVLGSPQPLPKKGAAGAMSVARQTILQHEGLAHLGDNPERFTKFFGLDTSILTEGLTAKFPIQQKITRELFQNNLIANKHSSGESTGSALESLMNLRMGPFNIAREKIHELYYDLAGIDGKFKATKSVINTYQQGRAGNLQHYSYGEYENQIMYTLRRGDVHPVPQIQKAAEIVRRDILEPIRLELVNLGILEPNSTVKGALSYIGREYNVDMILQYRAEFEKLFHDQFQLENRQIQAGARIYTPEGESLLRRARFLTRQGKIAEAARVQAEADLHLQKVMTQAEYEKLTKSIVDNITRLTPQKLGNGYLNDLGLKIGASATNARVVSVPEVVMERFLNNNLDQILNRHLRSLTKIIEAAKYFQRNNYSGVDDILSILKQEYDAEVPNMTVEERVPYAAEYKRSQQFIRDAFDVLFGVYDMPANNTGQDVGKAVQLMRTYNYLTKNGGVVISALPDLVQPIIQHGLEAWVSPALGALKASLMRDHKMIQAHKRMKDELRVFGIGLEYLATEKFLELSNLSDPYSQESFIAKTLGRLSDVAGHVFLINQHTDMTRRLAGVMASNRILTHLTDLAQNRTLPTRDIEFLASHGIDRNYYKPLFDEYQKHSYIMDGIMFPNYAEWDQNLADIIGSAINNATDATAVRTNKGDVPFIMHKEIGKTWLQFKSIFFAFWNKLTLNSLQRRDAYVATGLAAILMVGAAGYVVREVSYGNVPDLSIKRLAREALYNSGILGLPLELHQTAHTSGFAPAIAKGVDSLIPGTKQVYDDYLSGVSRYSSRGAWGAFLGPSFGTLEDASSLAMSYAKNGYTMQTVNLARRMVPLNNTFYMRYLFIEATKGLGEITGAEELGKRGKKSGNY